MIRACAGSDKGRLTPGLLAPCLVLCFLAQVSISLVTGSVCRVISGMQSCGDGGRAVCCS